MLSWSNVLEFGMSYLGKDDSRNSYYIVTKSGFLGSDRIT